MIAPRPALKSRPTETFPFDIASPFIIPRRARLTPDGRRDRLLIVRPSPWAIPHCRIRRPDLATQQRSIAEVSRELGINEALLGRWVADERRRVDAAAESGDQPLTAAERTELARLRKQVSEQEKDIAFLKKASAYAGDRSISRDRANACTARSRNRGRTQQNLRHGRHGPRLLRARAEPRRDQPFCAPAPVRRLQHPP